MLASCLLGSLTKDAINTVTNYEDEYVINKIPYGPLLLKVIIRESHIDTRFTSRAIRINLRELDQYMPRVNCDIKKFNSYVTGLINDLNARGESSNDLLMNLFEAYKVVDDDEFNRFILIKEQEYDDGQDITVQTLMRKAETKYATLVQRNAWNVPTAKDKKIMALESKVTTMQKELKKKKKGNKQNGNGNADGKNKQGHKWKTVAPKDNEPKVKEKNGKTYHWCPTHKSWTIHKPEDCKGLRRRNQPANADAPPDNPNNNNGNNNGGENDQRRLQLDAAMASAATAHQDE